METQSGWREAFAPAMWMENLGGSLLCRKAPITLKRLIRNARQKTSKKNMPRGWTNVWRGLFGSLLSNMTGM